MAEASRGAGVGASAETRRWWWVRWAGRAAGVWSLSYGLLGLYWAFGGSGFPFGVGNDPGSDLSILGGVGAEIGAPVIAGLGFAGAVVALAMARVSGRGALRLAFLVFASGVAVALALLVPDYRVLVAVAYAPIIVIGEPFGYPPGVGVLDAFPWVVINQFVLVAGGFLWAATALAYGLRSKEVRAGLGRAQGRAGWTTPESAARWGRWAVGVAVAVPVLYALTRWAWALGIPLGISPEFLREGQDVGLWWVGAGLATIAVGGAVLTVGLVRRWGEEFPRWIPFLGGGRVPVWFAVAPAALVSVLVTAAGLMFVRLTLTGQLAAILGEGVLTADNWAVLGPELLWPLWGAALGAATLAYYLRRRRRRERGGLNQPEKTDAEARSIGGSIADR